jgi:hypothetical protein
MRLLTAFLITASSMVWACPVCNSGTGQQVRQSILDDGFGFNLTVAALPILICAVVVRLMATGKLR